MARPKKDGSYFSCFMKTELSEKLHEYADKYDMTLTAAVERAVRQMIERDEQTDEGDRGASYGK